MLSTVCGADVQTACVSPSCKGPILRPSTLLLRLQVAQPALQRHTMLSAAHTVLHAAAAPRRPVARPGRRVVRVASQTADPLACALPDDWSEPPSPEKRALT